MQNGIPAYGQRPITNFSRPISGPAASEASSARSSSSATSIDSVETRRQHNIASLTEELRKHHIGGEEMEEHIHSRAVGLDEMGKDAEWLRTQAAKANTLDNISDTFKNFIEAIPFAISSYPAETLADAASLFFNVPKGSIQSEIAGGVMGGMSAMVLKAYGSKALANATHDLLWMAPDKAKLEPVMLAQLERRSGLGHSLKQAVVGGVGYDARNVVTGVVQTGMAHLPEGTQKTANAVMGTVLTPLAGGVSGLVSKHTSSLYGLEFLLGRTDWKERLTQLENTTVTHQMTHGLMNRSKTAMQDLFSSPRQIGKALMNPLSGNMVAETLTLASGLGGTNALRHFVRGQVQGVTKSANLVMAAEQAVNLLSAGSAYALQGIAGVFAGSPHSEVDGAIDHFFDTHPQLDLGRRLWESENTDPAEPPPRPDNPVAAQFDAESTLSGSSRSSVDDGGDHTNVIPLRNFSRFSNTVAEQRGGSRADHQRPMNPVAAQLERESNASKIFPPGTAISDPSPYPPGTALGEPSSSRTASNASRQASARVASRSELNALHMQQMIESMPGAWSDDD